MKLLLDNGKEILLKRRTASIVMRTVMLQDELEKIAFGRFQCDFAGRKIVERLTITKHGKGTKVGTPWNLAEPRRASFGNRVMTFPPDFRLEEVMPEITRRGWRLFPWSHSHYRRVQPRPLKLRKGYQSFELASPVLASGAVLRIPSWSFD